MFQMKKLDGSNKELGPFLFNSTLLCFNSSLLPSSSNFTSLIDRDELMQAEIPCKPQVDETMKPGLACFWNILFSFMIITALLGNSTVLWIVISKLHESVSVVV